MASLRDMQLAFGDAVFGGNGDRVATMVASDGISPTERVGIYRNNAQIGFANALMAEFPIVAQLSGEAWFRQTAREYQRKYPSRSGNLHHIGERFADYLRDLLDRTEHEYFGDVAALEWAYQEVLVAADTKALDFAELAHVAPENYGALQFHLHPAVRLVASDYPILKIWKMHKESTPDVDAPAEAFDLTESQLVLVQRCESHVQLRLLPLGEYTLLDAFARGALFSDAIEMASENDASFDVTAALPRLAALGLFAGFSIGAAH